MIQCIFVLIYLVSYIEEKDQIRVTQAKVQGQMKTNAIRLANIRITQHEIHRRMAVVQIVLYSKLFRHENHRVKELSIREHSYYSRQHDVY